jgi:murein DD-endopeptidase MepM/ murein hydrolase activator NlpD
MSSTAVGAGLVLVAALGWLAGPAGAEPAAAGAGPWAWPVAGPGAVSRPFVPPPHRYGVGHRGVDLLAEPGAAVVAAGAGRVSYAGLLAGRGVVVVVHGALRTTYEPVTATVGLGARVAAGEVIGALDAGHAGCPAPACLHWGLRRGEDYLDPVRLVERGPVRLLPLDGPAPAGAAARGGAVAGAVAGRAVAGGPVAGGAVSDRGPAERRVLAPAAVRAPAPAASRPDLAVGGTAAAALLGAAAVSAARRRGG